MFSTASNEFAVAVACCIWPPSEHRTFTIRCTTGKNIDWERFLRVVKRQRIAGLAYHGLQQAGVSVPPEIFSQLKKLASGIARQNFQFAVETARIQRLFDNAGIPVLFVKGITLGQLAYGSLVLKHSWDIDLLVTPDYLPEALHLLSCAGYHPLPLYPSSTDEDFKHWVKFAREYVLKHDVNSVYVEIHWKLSDSGYFLSGISALSPAQMVTVSDDMRIRTLTRDDLFVYLCVHGALHGWSRLKWLADVAALMAHDSESDAHRRLQLAGKYNARNCVVQTFLLCDHLFRTVSVAALSRELRQNYRYRWLERSAWGVMTSGNGEAELGDSSFSLLPIMISHFMLGRGWKFALNELWNKLNLPYDLRAAALPKRFAFLYPLMRMAAWLKRRGRLRRQSSLK